MTEPSNAEIKTLLEAMRQDMSSDRRERIASEVRVADRLEKIERNHANLVLDVGTRLDQIEETAKKADSKATHARDSLASFNATVDDLQTGLRAMDEKQTPLLVQLAQAKAREEERARLEEENRKKESIAAKRLAEEKEAAEKRAAAAKLAAEREAAEKAREAEEARERKAARRALWIPVVVTAITVVGGIVTTWIATSATAASHADTTAQIAELKRQNAELSRQILQQRVESPLNQPPAAQSPAAAPAHGRP